MHLAPQFTTTFHGLEAPSEKQLIGFVVYVSFGSQCFLSGEETAEVALGLEANYQPFLWALDGHSFWLPKGFVERVGEKGVVVRGWVPQREILAHMSIGSFMSHCGWNSLMDGMSNCFPFITSLM
ncbi:hypothetical protein SUGI_0849880 [Cryptomeria japonica]|nr:hypothetical protein SUGI_0849880 [Cryptomeria japonica]